LRRAQDIEASTRTKKRKVNKNAFTRSLVSASLEVRDARRRRDESVHRGEATETWDGSNVDRVRWSMTFGSVSLDVTASRALERRAREATRRARETLERAETVALERRERVTDE